MLKRAIVVLSLMVFFTASYVSESHAYSSSRWDSPSVGCYRYRVTYSRGGVFHLSNLFTIKTRVQWCMNSPYFTILFSGPTTHRNHDEGSTYQWGGWERKTIRKLSNPTRWIIFTQAKEIGISGWPLVFYDHPTIKIWIYKANPTHVAYEVHCNC